VPAAKRGDAEARVRLVEAFLPLAASLARRYASGAQVERLELVQEGVAGLLQALERNDVERDTPFWAYARHWVRRSMQRLVAELGDAVSLSDTALRTLARMRRAEDALMGELHREPTHDEIIARSGVDPDAGRRLLDRIEAEELLSLLSELSDRERQLLRWRFGLDGPELDPREIGERLGLGERRARDIERRARNKLRVAARGGGDGDGGG
jgi:RNA polymerase sigma factor (sigma-70 family)